MSGQDHIVDVIALRPAVMNELVSDLHHPVRAAFRARHHDHVVRTRRVADERVVLLAFAAMSAIAERKRSA